MEELKARIRDIYVPVKRAKTLDPARVQALAEDILDHGLKAPICVRRDDARFVLVEGLHRLEACRALGEDTIPAIVVQARRS
jgi:ParB-like chromosome segregation protein Spo0J